MSTPIPSGKTGLQAIIDLVRSGSSGDLSGQTISVSAPTALATPIGTANTSIVATVDSETHEGQVTLNYTRRPINDVWNGTTPIRQTVEEGWGLQTLLGIISQLTGRVVSESDIQAGPLELVNGAVKIVASVDSYFFIPGSETNIPLKIADPTYLFTKYTLEPVSTNTNFRLTGLETGQVSWRINGGPEETNPFSNLTIVIPPFSTSLEVRNNSPLPPVSGSLTAAARVLGIEHFQTDGHPPLGGYLKSIMVSAPEKLPPSMTSLMRLFEGAVVFNDAAISNWDTSNVTNMSYMFTGAVAFNRSLDSWDVSKVVDFIQMFRESRYNQPLNSWNLAAANNINGMFQSNTAFNQPLNKWNTSNITLMPATFRGATAFNQDLSMWAVSQVTSYGFFSTSASSWTLPKPAFV